MPVDENPEDDPMPEHIKELLDKIKTGSDPSLKNQKSSKKTASKKTASKKTASKKTASKKTASKKTAKKPKQKAPIDINKLMHMIEEDPEMLAYRRNTKAVAAKIYEHLNCFILIGYTDGGDPVQITSARTPRDYDALSTALQKYVVELLPKGPPGNSF